MPRVARTASRIDPERFIKTWQESANLDEVVRKLNVEKEKITQKASYFRGHNIPLKRMPKGIGGPNWDNLKKVAEKHLSSQ